MASYFERVRAVAQALVAAAGMAHAVAATDVRAAAERLHRDYADYSKVQIAEKIAAEIKQSHQPGVSGPV